MRGGGGKDVAPVKSVADLGQPVARVGQLHQRLHLLAGHHVAKEAVIRPDEHAPWRAQGDGPPRAAHAWIHHDQVYGVLWEEGIGSVEHVGGLADVLRRDVVSDVHQPGIGRDVEDDALHSPYVAVGCAKVGGEGDERDFFHRRVFYREAGKSSSHFSLDKALFLRYNTLGTFGTLGSFGNETLFQTT